MMRSHRVVFAVAVLSASSAMGDVVERVFWNPGVGHRGDTDPFMGESTDDTLAQAGLLTQVGLSRVTGAYTIAFADVPSVFSEDHYIEFSIIPGSGQVLDVHDLILQAADNGRPMPLDRIVLRSEVDGFATDHAALAGPTGLQGNTGRPVLFDLETLPDLHDETTFRLYVWGISGPFGIPGSVVTRGYGMWFGDVDSTPAPSSLVAIGLGLCTVRRRRR